MYKTIIYDVDGTLIDTEKAVLGSLQKLLTVDYGKSVPIEELSFVLGIPGTSSLPQLGITDIDHANDRWNFFMKDFFNTIKVFDGITELLLEANKRNIQQGIVTSKTKEELINDFVPFGLSSYLTYVVNADDTEKHKPNPEPILKFLEISGAEPKKTIYIGDTVYDFQCARDAGVDFGLAVWGCKNKDKIHAKHILNTPQDLLDILKL